MIMLKCLSQGSIGNCYILQYNDETLLLDAGIGIKEIKRGLDYNLMSVSGVMITHSHTDHSKSADDLKNMGLRVYKPYEQKEPVKRFGAFTVQVMEVPHGVCECYAFYIKVSDRRILYATDLEYFKYSMAKVKLTDVIFECNYQDEYLNLNAENIVHKATGHCSLETCKEFIEHNVTEELKTVILTHLGVETCNGVECVEEIRQVVPESVIVDYAQAGRTWYLG